jgi:SAM-dependent methyltransferase
MIYHKAKQVLYLLLPKSILYKFERFLRNVFALFYKGNNVYCPICECHFKKFIPLNPNIENTNFLCPKCGSAQRQRLLWLYISGKFLILTERLTFIHFSPRSCLVNKLKSIAGLTYITSDPVDKKMDRNYDLTGIEENDARYDLAVCYHIMEHIHDDRKAMREIYRILKSTGTALLQVPYWEKETYENPAIDSPEIRRKTFGQQDHVRIYGYQDFIDRLTLTGFQVTPVKYGQQLGQQICHKYGLDQDEVIFVCRKE